MSFQLYIIHRFCACCRKLCCLIAILFAFVTVAQSQTSAKDFKPLWKTWERFFTETQGFEAKDATLLSDGRTLLIAGVRTESAGQSIGVVYAMDRQKGVLLPKPYQQLNCAFNGITQADDGSVFVTGALVRPVNDRKALIVQLDNETLRSEWQDTTNDDAFGKIVWLNYGTGLMAAQDAKGYPGNIRIYRVMHRKIRAGHITTGGYIENLAAILPIPTSDTLAWLAGTTKKGKATKKGDVWMLKIDEQGNSYESPYFHTEEYDAYLRSASISSKDGQMLFAGQAMMGSEKYSPLFVEPSTNLEVDKSIKPFANEINPADESNLSNYISAVCATGGHNFLYLNTVDDRKQFLQTLGYTKNGKTGTPIETLKGLNDFQPAGFLRDSARDEYFLVGMDRALRTTQSRLCIVAIKESYDKGKGKSKGATAKMAPPVRLNGLYPIECENIVFKEPDDEHPDNILSPKERGVVWFTLVNKSDSTLNGPLIIKTTSLKVAAGVTVNPVYEIGSMAPRDKRVVKIGIKAADVVGYNPCNQFEIQIMRDREIVGNCVSPCIKTGKVEGKLFRISDPPEEKNGGRKETEHETYPVSIVVERNINEVPPTQIKLRKEKFVGRPQKAPEWKISDETPERYVITYNVELEEGENRLYFQLPDSLGGERSAEVVIVRKKRNPNVAVLSIGVPYKGNKYIGNLDFPAQDAQDFANGIVELQKSGFYGNLSYLKVLNTPANTTRDSIALAFEELSRLELDSFSYLFIFISSHGLSYLNRPYIVPSNYSGNISLCVSYQQMIDDYISLISCRRFVFLDACHSDAGKGINQWNDIPWQKNMPPNMVAFFSSRSSQVSWECKKRGHGVFTQAVLDAIYGKGTPEGKIYLNIADLDAFINKRVAEICKDPEEEKAPPQEPISRNRGLPVDLPVFGILKD